MKYDDDVDGDTTAEVDSTMDPPPIQNLNPPSVMDWLKLPRDLEATVEEGTIDVFAEINRAKSHKCFPFFMQWLINWYDLPEHHVWGHPEDEPVEDLRDFISFLVEAGYGNYAGDNMETHQLHDTTSVEEARTHSLHVVFLPPQKKPPKKTVLEVGYIDEVISPDPAFDQVPEATVALADDELAWAADWEMEEPDSVESRVMAVNGMVMKLGILKSHGMNLLVNIMTSPKLTVIPNIGINCELQKPWSLGKHLMGRPKTQRLNPNTLMMQTNPKFL